MVQLLDSLLRLVSLLVVLAAIAGCVYLCPQYAQHRIIYLLMFGVWSMACVWVGSRLSGGRGSPSLFPSLPPFDSEPMFNWLRHGKTKPQPGDEVPPLAEVTDEQAQIRV